MKTTLAIIDAAIKDHPRACLAFSGGADSLVLLDIIYRLTPYRPLVVFADSGMEYEWTLPFIRTVCRHFVGDNTAGLDGKDGFDLTIDGADFIAFFHFVSPFGRFGKDNSLKG